MVKNIKIIDDGKSVITSILKTIFTNKISKAIFNIAMQRDENSFIKTYLIFFIGDIKILLAKLLCPIEIPFITDVL